MPQEDESLIDKDLEDRMALAQKSTSMVLALRRKVNIKVRQPLSRLMIPVIDSKVQSQLEKVQNIILSEVNVKEIEYITDTEGLITKKIKPMFKTLGKKYGRQMKEISSAFANFTQKDISEIERSGEYTMHLPGGDVVLEKGDYEISSEDMPGWLVASEGSLTLALDIQISDELRREGTARELVNRIQNLRKDSGFEVTDRISVVVESQPDIAEAIEGGFSAYVCAQTLANSLTLAGASSPELEGASEVEWEDGKTLKIKVER